MKITNARLDEIADQWSGAYRADYNGRAVSCQIIKAMFVEVFDMGGRLSYICQGEWVDVGTFKKSKWSPKLQFDLHIW